MSKTTTPDLAASIQKMESWCSDGENVTFDAQGYLSPDSIDAIRSVLDDYAEQGRKLEAAEAVVRVVRDNVPMAYLETHGDDTVAALREYSKDRWELIERINDRNTTIAALTAEVEQLRLAICGGEDAPGYAASLPLQSILDVASQNTASWHGEAERAISLEAEVERLKGQASQASTLIRVAMNTEDPIAKAALIHAALDFASDDTEALAEGAKWAPIDPALTTQGES